MAACSDLGEVADHELVGEVETSFPALLLRLDDDVVGTRDPMWVRFDLGERDARPVAEDLQQLVGVGRFSMSSALVGPCPPPKSVAPNSSCSPIRAATP